MWILCGCQSEGTEPHIEDDAGSVVATGAGASDSVTPEGSGPGGAGGNSALSGPGSGGGSGSGGGGASVSSGGTFGIGAGAPSTCSIMSSNEVCASCIESLCCDQLHDCLDASPFACVQCLDCHLDASGCDSCDPSVGAALDDCVTQSCASEC